jgi:hypothetical protein
MSRWLLWRVDGLAFHEAGYEAVREISRATERVRNIVFFKPAPRMYLGLRRDHEDGPAPATCTPARTSGRTTATCAARLPGRRRRADDGATLDDKLFTAAEIAHLATYLGLEVTVSVCARSSTSGTSASRSSRWATMVRLTRFRYGAGEGDADDHVRDTGECMKWRCLHVRAAHVTIKIQ